MVNRTRLEGGDSSKHDIMTVNRTRLEGGDSSKHIMTVNRTRIEGGDSSKHDIITWHGQQNPHRGWGLY